MRILLVDDSEALRLTLAAILEDAGHLVTEAESLASARGRLSGAGFDLVLLDVHLPDGRGPSLIAEVRNSSPAATIAVLTGAPERIDGADAVLVKGEDPELLLSQIERVATRS